MVKENNIRSKQKKWEQRHAAEFEQERQREFHSSSGIPIKRCYTPVDLEDKGFSYNSDLGFPGEYPFTRGVSPTMYRGQLWSMSQVSGRPTPREMNELLREIVSAQMSNRLAVEYDLPCALGYDPGHPLAQGEVGRIGVSLASQKDWEIAFEGIDVGKFIVQQYYTALAPVGLGNHLLIAEKQGVDLGQLRGHIQNDILKEYTARGTYIFPPEQGLRAAIDVICYCAEHVPNYEPIAVCAYQFAEKGADPVHEIAFALANAFTYVEKVIERGLAVDSFAPGIRFLTTCNHFRFFEEIAKLRALRKIYAKVMKERFKAKKPESMRAWILAAQGGIACYQEQYLNNIPRSTLAVLAGALAGAQWISARPYDEAFGTPTEDAMLMALRTQHVIAQETDITQTVDPLGGSYFMETLTSETEEKILAEMDNIERQGGVVRCIEEGYLERKMVEGAYKWQKALESGEMVRVGVNRYTNIRAEDKRPSRVYRADLRAEKERIADIKRLKKERDNKRVQKALQSIKEVALMGPSKDTNLVPPVIEALRVYATVGEVADTLRQAWGGFKRPHLW